MAMAAMTMMVTTAMNVTILRELLSMSAFRYCK
jgi:hypothetical protein